MSNNQPKSKVSKKKVPGFTFVQSVGDASEYTMDRNGMQVLLVHVPGSPAVTTNIVYRVGSADETHGETGLAHMLEHMLFKPVGDKRKKTWKDLEEKGALLNATTWMDRTMYYFNLPTEYLNDMLEVEATRMRSVVLTDEEFKPERTNVLSELEMYYSSAGEALDWNVASTAFQSHGYGHTTIGFKNDVERYTLRDLKRFYDTYYWPHNATLIIVGDVPAAHALSLVEKNFGNIKAADFTVPTRRGQEPVQEGERRVSLARHTPLRILSMNFKAPAFQSRDWLALMLAFTYLAEGKTSVLAKSLIDTHLATAIKYFLYPTKDPYLATFSISVTEKTAYEKVEQLVFEAIEALSEKPIPAGKLKELKELQRSSELFSRDGTFSIASGIAEYVATGDWTYYYRHLDEIASISAKEIQTAVRTYLRRDTVTIGTIRNK